jgi:uncharacterized membrane protein
MESARQSDMDILTEKDEIERQFKIRVMIINDEQQSAILEFHLATSVHVISGLFLSISSPGVVLDIPRSLTLSLPLPSIYERHKTIFFFRHLQ